MSFEKLNTLTRKIVAFDIVINITVGIFLVLFPDYINRFLFNKQILPPWLIAAIGFGFLLFAIWQVAFFIKPQGFTIRNLRFAAVLAWIPCLGLTFALLSEIGGQLLIFPRIILWVGNIYMLLLGGLYYWLAAKIVKF